MNIVIVHGQSHKGSTYNIARILAGKLNGNIEEFFLPRDWDKFCTGCNNCFTDENLCPHREKLAPLIDAIDLADVIILASPVYVFRASGAMKNFLDHNAYRWMVHRPEEAMFSKQGVCISTAAGAGMGKANKDMAISMFFWGIGKIYKYGVGVAAVDFESISEKTKKKIEKDTDRLAARIKNNYGKVKPSHKTKAIFNIMAKVQADGWNPADVDYWVDKGWTQGKRPW